MFEFVNLPIGAIRADALAIEVNCLGVLDTIFSPQVRALFPEVVAAYKASFDAGDVEAGRIMVVDRGPDQSPRYFFCWPTKTHWNGERRSATVEFGISDLLRTMLRLGAKSLAVPAFGSSRGLDWTQVKLRLLTSFARVPDIKLLISPSHDASEKQSLKHVSIFADGGAEPNRGVGGYGVVLRFGEVMRELAGGYRRTTNNRMELLGAIVGLEALKESCYVRLHSDSQYLVEYVNKGTLFRLHSAGWKGKQTKNIDLWKRFLEAYLRHEVELVWVKRHAGVDDNERCDQLATLAMRCGELPVDQGYVDEATARAKKSKSESQRQLPQFTLSTPDSSATSPLEAATSEAKRGPKPKKEGDPCRYCQIPLIRRTTKKSNPNSAYYYPWHLYCEKCKRLYHVPEAKVIRGKEMP